MRPSLLLIVLVLLPRPAAATYSIVVADRETGQVGGAIASCVDLDLATVYRSAPGLGAVHAQARVSAAGRDLAVELLHEGLAPAGIITRITDPAVDPRFAERQFGVVDLAGRAAGFTGASTFPVAADRQRVEGRWVISVQGNILTSEAVLTQLEEGFSSGDACDLPARLMQALEAASANGQGDSRCTPAGHPASAAHLQVDLPDRPSGSYLSLGVQGQEADPAIALRAAFDAWRESNPCPAAPVAADDAARERPEAPPGGCATAPRSSAPGWIFLGPLLALFVARFRSNARGSARGSLP